jgi:peptidoglycan/xylan/chitin deacetylase (PgdA/CDA1 family)
MGRGLVTRSIGIVLALGVLAAALPASAGAWPKPAAGRSASGDPEVLFTFDDGPDEVSTPRILDTLAQHKIQAIFFWVGRRVRGKQDFFDARRALVERAVLAGHLVGNHTIYHAKLCVGDAAEAAREIDENGAIYAALTRLPMLLFRAPYGAKCPRLVEMLAERGLSHLHWDIDPQDFGDHDSKATAAAVIGRLTELKGRAVILLHDTHASSAKALPLILDWIDAENARRRANGQRPIRILSASSVMAERLDRPLADWARGAAIATAGALIGDLRRLLPASVRSAARGHEHRGSRSAHRELGR